jgi:hypothetical protein
MHTLEPDKSIVSVVSAVLIPRHQPNGWLFGGHRLDSPVYGLPLMVCTFLASCCLFCFWLGHKEGKARKGSPCSGSASLTVYETASIQPWVFEIHISCRWRQGHTLTGTKLRFQGKTFDFSALSQGRDCNDCNDCNDAYQWKDELHHPASLPRLFGHLALTCQYMEVGKLVILPPEPLHEVCFVKRCHRRTAAFRAVLRLQGFSLHINHGVEGAMSTHSTEGVLQPSRPAAFREDTISFALETVMGSYSQHHMNCLISRMFLAPCH